MAKVSIIIPYYNTKEEYFQSCINSILKQTFSDYEVIIVDDGSDQEYAETVDRIAAIDTRIKVYHQENQGVSITRNNGLSYVTSKYIAFVDADDKVMPQFLESAYQEAEKNNADIVYGFVKRTAAEAKDIYYDKPVEAKIVTDSWLKKYHIGFLYRDKEKMFGRGPVSRLIKTEVAKKVGFPPQIPIGEDVIWNMEIIKVASRKYIVDSIWYNYIQREESVTCRYSPNIEEKLRPFYTAIQKTMKDTVEDRYLYTNRVLRDLKRYIYDIYLGHKDNNEGFIKKWILFNAICKKEPWNKVGRMPLKKCRDKDIIIKYILFKIRLLYPVWKIRDII